MRLYNNKMCLVKLKAFKDAFKKAFKKTLKKANKEGISKGRTIACFFEFKRPKPMLSLIHPILSDIPTLGKYPSGMDNEDFTAQDSDSLYKSLTSLAPESSVNKPDPFIIKRSKEINNILCVGVHIYMHVRVRERTCGVRMCRRLPFRVVTHFEKR